ncbi:hypothetical protein GRF29_106g229777 [Pseudopithomyces chartarum]|uniref:Uncharacterized protein n=1 Tax=Pseudopithomyces chartarum TaxID=1892770 RepID=A0AAN6RGX1_9PLEO|nr:hypothetical protein GRF29_106g229777 [Pseudopithomyces chartarum]
MLDIHRDDGPDPKIYFSHCTLPSYIDPQNVSTKKKPFSTFNAQPFSHTLDLILPEEIYSLIQTKLLSHGTTTYAKVHMSLSDILDPDFFNPYIKQGNITMLSSPRPALPSLSLHSGTLTLTLDLPTYQRCGLPGIPIEYGGAKHQKSVYRVAYDLRSPSMTHGKKGFKRLEWAAKNVLSENFTWLFYNARASSAEALREGKEPLSKHHPTICEVEPEVERSVYNAHLHSTTPPPYKPSPHSQPRYPNPSTPDSNLTNNQTHPLPPPTMRLLLTTTVLLAINGVAHAGPIGYGICQAGCAAVVMACYGAAGFTWGATAGATAPASIVACNSAFGTCQAACAAVLLGPTP